MINNINNNKLVKMQVKKSNPYQLLVGMKIYATIMESSMAFPQKTKNRRNV
jgi:hypothetical protein